MYGSFPAKNNVHTPYVIIYRHTVLANPTYAFCPVNLYRVWIRKSVKNLRVKVYAGSHQRALRKGSQLVLTLARAPSKNEKNKQQN